MALMSIEIFLKAKEKMEILVLISYFYFPNGKLTLVDSSFPSNVCNLFLPLLNVSLPEEKFFPT